MNNGFNQSSPYGGVQPPYGNGTQWYSEQYQNYAQKEQEKQKVKKIGSKCGLAVVLYIAISYALSFFIVLISWIFPSISRIYIETIPSLAFDIIVSCVSIGAPFFIAHLILKREKFSQVLPFGTTYNRKAATYLIMIFLPIMVLSAIAINYISAIFQAFLGIEFTSSVSNISFIGTKETVFGILGVAVVPAIIEETAIRGIVMQPLRKYGDKFAIIASSLLFACMHGNMVQIPYTIVGGLILGYLVIATGSLWPSIILHFFNNLYSVIVVSASSNFNESISVLITAFMLIMFAVIGVVGAVKFIRMKYKVSLSNGETLLTTREKVKSFLMNGPSIIAIILLVFVTMSNIDF